MNKKNEILTKKYIFFSYEFKQLESLQIFILITLSFLLKKNVVNKKDMSLSKYIYKKIHE